MTIHSEIYKRLRLVEAPSLVSSYDSIVWRDAKGSEVFDCEGKKYIDFSSGFGVSSIGFSHPHLSSLIKIQVDKLINGLGDVFPSIEKLELLEKLSLLLGFKGKAILSSTGTEAVETSLKTAYLYTEKPCVICFEGAYHGLGYGVLRSAGRKDFYDKFIEQTSDIFIKIPFPEFDCSENESLLLIEKTLNQGKIGAILLEPIQGRGGIRLFPDGFLKKTNELARKHNALLILDEIMTGFGRTGSMFAFEQEKILPDIIALGKALGGGLPISVSYGKEEIMNVWKKTDLDSIHTSTFLGHPLASKTALKTIEIIEKENLAAAAQNKGQKIIEFLKSAVELKRWKIRGRGLMIGIDCGNSADALKIVKKSLDNGLILLVDGINHETIVILPALNIPDGLLAEGLEILCDAILTT